MISLHVEKQMFETALPSAAKVYMCFLTFTKLDYWKLLSTDKRQILSFICILLLLKNVEYDKLLS